MITGRGMDENNPEIPSTVVVMGFFILASDGP